MTNLFFEKPILNSPYAYPERHWELDAQGQPTQAIIDKRRRAEFITPIPKPKKRKGSGSQTDLLFDEGAGLTTAESYCLAQIPDFNTLIATSQTHQTPVFALTDEMFGHAGTVLEQEQAKRAEFQNIFEMLADRIIMLAEQ